MFIESIYEDRAINVDLIEDLILEKFEVDGVVVQWDLFADMASGRRIKLDAGKEYSVMEKVRQSYLHEINGGGKHIAIKSGRQ